MRKIAIIIPAHNEERRIGRTLEAYSEFFNKISKEREFDYEILVVVNNTNDKTVEVVKNSMRKNNKINYLNLLKGGKGYAVIEGFKDALKRKNDLIGFVDADMATLPEHYFELIDKIKNHSGAIASRYVKGSKVKPRNTIPRILASRLYNAVIRAILLIPYRDTQCGAKVFRRNAVESCINEIGMTQLAFDIELLYKLGKKGFNIKEMPTVWADREYSTINFWNSGPWMTLAIVRLRLLNSPFKWTVGAYDRVMSKIHRMQKSSRSKK